MASPKALNNQLHQKLDQILVNQAYLAATIDRIEALLAQSQPKTSSSRTRTVPAEPPASQGPKTEDPKIDDPKVKSVENGNN